MLLARGAPPNATEKNREGDSVLIAAAGSSSLQSIELLLAAGADIKSTNERGQTALMQAVAVDQRYRPETRLPMIELLLKKGSDVNAKDKDGRSALHYSVVQYMSEAGGVIRIHR
jgi:ankyrin repeat protein